MQAINIKVPERDIDEIDEIVAESQSETMRTTQKYDNRSDFFRVAAAKLAALEHKEIEKKMLAESMKRV